MDLAYNLATEKYIDILFHFSKLDFIIIHQRFVCMVSNRTKKNETLTRSIEFCITNFLTENFYYNINQNEEG